MQVKVEKLAKSTVKLNITVPSTKVQEEYEKLFEEIVKNTELPGFRKGAAPKELVKEKTDASKLYGEVINNLLQKYYPQALKESLIAPVSNPRVEIKEFDINKDFEFSATVAIKPDVKIEEYKDKLKKLYDDKVKKAREENAKKLAEGEPVEDIHVHLHPNDVIDTLIEVSKVEVPELLIEDETDRMMSRLIDQAQAIGLSLEQYLKAQNKSADQLRNDYGKLSERNLKAEFVLGHMVKELKVKVDDKEIDEALKASGSTIATDIEKLYIRSILEKNKLITNIIEEVEVEKGGHKHE